MKNIQLGDIERSEELELCASGHYDAVIDEDEYKIQELFDADKEIEYIVDLGANLGTASMHIQNFFPNAKILVCEPHPDLMHYAKLNTDNKLTYIEEAIIGDDRKEVTFNICRWAGNGHVDGNFRWDLFEPMGSEKVREITVKASTLKDIMDKNNFPRIDLLKVDTEGMEGQILTAFKPFMHLVKHVRGEWHGDLEIPIIKDALKDTHNVFIDRRLKTHGDVFAVRKDYKPTEEIVNGYRVSKTPGLPNKLELL